MKEAGKLGVNEGTSYRMRSVSEINFEQPGGNEGNFQASSRSFSKLTVL